MSRRTAERLPKRIEVRFWRRGNPQAHAGYTIDVSKSGIFLGTSQTLEPGERLRLELVERDRAFMVEGQVARVHRVSLALRHIEQSGVGVRFLTPAELLQEILGTRGKGGARLPESAATSAPVAPASAAAAPAPAAPKSAALSGSFAPMAQTRDKQVSVEFVDRASFLNVYQRDIASGGLFVSTQEPAKLHDIVTVELRPPVATTHPLLFEARVVHCLDGAADGRGVLRGMGVQFLDPDSVRAALAPIITELRR